MSWSYVLPLLVMGTSLLTALLVFPLREERFAARTALNLIGATLKLVLVAVMVAGTMRGVEFESRLPFMPGIELVFRADFLALLFVSLSALLWLLTTVYAIGYLEESPHRSRFFGFFSLCVMATMGIALAGNLITFFVFYEMLTVVTYPLVVHRGTVNSLKAGRTYLLYTLFGGTLFLLGAVWLHALVGPADFTIGGVVTHLVEARRPELVLIFALLIAGLGVKAALVPLHGWLPEAMVAPAPVSALLHAVAVVKAGAFGIVRVIYDVYGIRTAADLGVLTPLAIAAAVTIVYGSVRALTQDDLKKRLAFSTVSQLSYIMLGVAIVGPLATTGGVVHLIHQGIMKITLFMCAGVVAEILHIKKVSEMAGVGRRLPLTMAAFTVAAFGMMGVPPTAGFVSKWYLGLGGLDAGQNWVLLVLATSSLLNALYFLPVVYTAFFRPPSREPAAQARRGLLEANWMLVLPPVATAALTLAAGIFAGLEVSPLGLAERAAAAIYGP
jgi:formate hydrogenlyase subunit 3/multisubunit Na+/H+ antiporter MnhD subunit